MIAKAFILILGMFLGFIMGITSDSLRTSWILKENKKLKEERESYKSVIPCIEDMCRDCGECEGINNINKKAVK